MGYKQRKAISDLIFQQIWQLFNRERSHKNRIVPQGSCSVRSALYRLCPQTRAAYIWTALVITITLRLGRKRKVEKRGKARKPDGWHLFIIIVNRFSPARCLVRYSRLDEYQTGFFLSLGPNLGNNIPALLPGVENGGTSSSYHSVYTAWLYEPLHNELEWEEESDKAHAKGRE